MTSSAARFLACAALWAVGPLTTESPLAPAAWFVLDLDLGWRLRPEVGYVWGREPVPLNAARITASDTARLRLALNC